MSTNANKYFDVFGHFVPSKTWCTMRKGRSNQEVGDIDEGRIIIKQGNMRIFER